jgi:hypothetical protein
MTVFTTDEQGSLRKPALNAPLPGAKLVEIVVRAKIPSRFAQIQGIHEQRQQRKC